VEKRNCKVFANLENIDTDKWTGLQTLVQVKRVVEYKTKTTKEVAYFLSSLPSTTRAKIFNQGIRDHWSVEAFHFVKDTVFEEDKWRCKKGNSAANYSLCRNFAFNAFHQNELHSIQAAKEKCANRVKFMLSLF
jgi:predicted transposase YbfD/YdcC